jgi:acetyl-CoA carboxylase carboxyltransferase component
LPALRRNNRGMIELRSPLQAQVVECAVAAGDVVCAGDVLLVVEAMKMEHELRAAAAGTVTGLHCGPGDMVHEGELLLTLDPTSALAGENPSQAAAAPAPAAPEGRADLQRLWERERFLADAARPQAVARRHAMGMRMARENVADLCDPDSFIEYGALTVAAQRSRRTEEDLIAATPADGMVTGIGTVNGQWFGSERGRVVVMAYDATVLAGTQGMRNHAKTDRLLDVALAQRLPVVLFAEGGGGRPGDTDMPVVAGLHVGTFAAFARLSGVVPVVGVVAGRCFAGNAALAGCCDTIIATRSSNLGMGGPAMVEGGGLGVFRPEDIGPAGEQHANGVIDLLVDDEGDAVVKVRQYLAYFQGSLDAWTPPDVRRLRSVVPENRLRVYDSRDAVASIADEGSVLYLRAGFGLGIHTALARIEGRPVGLLASNPAHLGGAIDADAADKAARFMQLCDAHGLPMITLVDTPGFMVGPEAERQAQVRHVSRLFVTAARLRIPVFSVVLRKAYGLGAMGMTAGGFHVPVFTVAWPSAEFGAMGLEGAVRLGYRKELEAQPEGQPRERLFEQLLAREYEKGSALSMASGLEIDAVIDPAQTRAWLVRGLAGARMGERQPGRFIDTW